MALTGHGSGPALGPPSGLVSSLQEVAASIADRSAILGRPVVLDPLGVLTERAAIAGIRRRGRTSCGGAARLLPTVDGWLAVSLTRPEDIELVPAWIGSLSVARHVADDEPPWDALSAAVAEDTTGDVLAAGALLGLPVAALGEAAAPAVITVQHGPGAGFSDLSGVRVVDVSALWAGPLCGSVLADAGATVVKVESSTRPDGARDGAPRFFDLLNAGKRSVALDLGTDQGRVALRHLINESDVVIEASRPRALEQLGVCAHEVLRSERPSVWLSITGHGRGGPGRGRVGFGDDAAVAGGLVSHAHDGPVFCADAVADPCTGLVAASAVLDALGGDGSVLLDVAMARVAASLAGSTLPAVDAEPTAPVARRDRGRASSLGEHTDEVLAEYGARG